MSDHLKEQTLILAKPDALQRGLVGELIRRFEMRGFKLSALKMVHPSRKHIEKHYLPTKEQLEGMGNKTLENLRSNNIDVKKVMGTENVLELGKIINEWNLTFLSSGPIIAMVFEGLHAVEMGRKIVGHTLPIKAEAGTIRGDYSSDSPLLANLRKRAVRNLVHASGDLKEAQREIKHWFKSDELHSYVRADESAMY